MTIFLRALILGYALAVVAAAWLAESGVALWAACLIAWIGGNVLGLAFTAIGAALWPACREGARGLRRSRPSSACGTSIWPPRPTIAKKGPTSRPHQPRAPHAAASGASPAEAAARGGQPLPMPHPRDVATTKPRIAARISARRMAKAIFQGE